jgi:hypothetical protein
MHTSLSPRSRALVTRLTYGLFASVLMLSAPNAASAAGLLDTASSADGLSAARPSSLGNLVIRSRLVRVNAAELARHVAPLGADTAADRIDQAARLDGIVTIELFTDAVATFQRKSIDTIGDSGYAWVGEVNGNLLNFASLIVENGEVTGHIQLTHRLFNIEPLKNGLHLVTEIDTSKFGRELIVPGRARGPAAPQAPNNDDAGTRATGKSIVNVLVAYTKAAKKQDNNIVTHIKQAVSLANAAYANTKIPIKVVLLKTVSAGTYKEAGNGSDGFQGDLNNLDGTNGAALQNIRNMRNQLKADLVSMFRKSDTLGLCGIANLTDTPNGSTTDFAYSIMAQNCISNLSFHHEMGHNMGLRHDRYVDPSQGVGYNHGYVNTAAQCKIRSIMGYNNDCAARGFNCTRINAFSTGKFVVTVGSTNCAIGTNKGKPNAADNTQRLKETRTPISNYRGGPAHASAVADAF